MASPVVVSRIQNRRGIQSQFNALYPPGYGGIGGYNSVAGFTPAAYPNVLAPGELALVTDTRRTFIGNLNGEFLELAEILSSGIFLEPVIVQLPPVGVFTMIPTIPTGLIYPATPFTTFFYDVTDAVSPDWDTVGTTFSRNGELQVTATAPFAPILNPPFPPITPVSLLDTGIEINTALPNTISFMAQYDITSTHIEILYQHNFPGNLTFSTSTLKWLPF